MPRTHDLVRDIARGYHPTVPTSSPAAEASASPPLVTGYAPPGEAPPFRGYLALAGLYQVLAGVGIWLVRRSPRDLPRRVEPYDVVIVGAATHKASRLIAKDKVTSFARAPFTQYEGPGGPGEVEESPRGHGLRYAVGELLVCPYCLGMWISTAFVFGLVLAPRPTRLLAGILVSLGISDFLQIAYKAAEHKAP